jgi:ATP-binding cassette, subfamily B, bacterial
MKLPETDPQGLMRKTLKIYIQEAWRYPGLFVGAFGSSLIYFIGEDIIVPLLIARLVDILVTAPVDFGAAYLVLWTLVAVEAADFLLARLTFRFRNPMLARVTQNISMRIFKTFEAQEYAFFTNSFIGSLVTKANRFIMTFSVVFDNFLFPLLQLVVQLTIPTIILATKSIWLSLAFLGIAAIMATITFVLSRYKTIHLRRSAEADSRVTGALADALTNNLATKVFARRDHEEKLFKAVTDDRKRLYTARTRSAEHIRALRTLGVFTFQISVAYILIRITESSAITFGTLVLTQIFLTRLAGSLWMLNNIMERLEEALSDAFEMTEVMLRQPLVNDTKNPELFHPAKGEVVLDNVTFAYHDDVQQEALFQKLNIVIKPGQKVGLVGPSGGGKTTLTKLLLRFMDIASGEIRIDGQAIDQVRQDELRSFIAYVPQEPLLFHRTVFENIAYGDISASREEIITAAKLAHAHEFIEQLPLGYDTLVGERGVKLSGGEKQRVAIARAMLKKAPILILDEATSALDSKSEKAIQEALGELMKNRTTIVIAHRLSTIRKLDRIVVMKDGQIVEDGSHAALIKKKNGIYADLWAHQSGEFLPES